MVRFFPQFTAPIIRSVQQLPWGFVRCGLEEKADIICTTISHHRSAGKNVGFQGEIMSKMSLTILGWLAQQYYFMGLQ
jgi:hypothetical protein